MINRPTSYLETLLGQRTMVMLVEPLDVRVFALLSLMAAVAGLAGSSGAPLQSLIVVLTLAWVTVRPFEAHYRAEQGNRPAANALAIKFVWAIVFAALVGISFFDATNAIAATVPFAALVVTILARTGCLGRNFEIVGKLPRQ